MLRQLFPLSANETSKCIPKVIGMIHALALPGTPGYIASKGGQSDLAIQKILGQAQREAELFSKFEGIDGLIVENMNDAPYLKTHMLGPEVIATMTAVSSAVRSIFPREKPVGIQILAGANCEALAVAKASQLQFIRAENFVFSHVADEGIMPDASAGPLLRYRRQIDAEHIAILCDIKKKHSAHSITSDVDICEMAKAADFFRADGIILTGSSTGQEANATELESVRKALGISSMPICIGSGISPVNVEKFRNADVFIVGTYFKKDGKWQNELDENRIRQLLDNIEKLKAEDS